MLFTYATTQQIIYATIPMIPPSLQKRSYLVMTNQRLASEIFELRLKPENPEDRIPMPEAGQWVYLELPDESGKPSDLRRAYSIASAPNEIEKENGEIIFAIKLAGEVTKALELCEEGSRLWLQGPFGRFVITHDQKNPVVFIAGGIGITPLRSMIIESLHKDPNRSLTLLLSCKTKEEIPYHSAMLELAGDQPNFVYTPTCTRETGDKWNGMRGRISEDQLRQLLEQSPETEWYLCGPNSLMDELSALLKNIGVEAKKIHTEKFG